MSAERTPWCPWCRADDSPNGHHVAAVKRSGRAGGCLVTPWDGGGWTCAECGVSAPRAAWVQAQRWQAAADAMRDRERARTEAAEAEVARLRADRDRVDLAAHSLTLACDAARAEADALRAIVEGRDVAPTRDAIDAHHATGGRWLAQWSNGTSTTVQHPSALSHLAEESCEPGRRLRVVRWWALDATGRPCPWPTVTP